MNTFPSQATEGPTPSRIFPVLAAALFFLLAGGGAAAAHAAEKASFSWLANPPEDNVIGYRLYYGSESRYTLNQTLKTNFTYDYYIDFAEAKRCLDDGTDANCRDLSAADFQCQNLYGEAPLCTVYGLNGLLYFAMTAYNAQAESDFTPELSVRFGIVPPNAQLMSAINLLLLDRKK